MRPIPLIVGEILVDFTHTGTGKENKLRLGGIAHAARGLWAADVPFSVAAILPSYLEDLARHYFETLGCVNFHVLAEVRGAPNVIFVQDATEVANQGYDDLLREEKKVITSTTNLTNTDYRDILIFPGSYSLKEICAKLPVEATLHLDVAYDLESPDVLAALPQTIATVMISTSSPLFQALSEKTLVGLTSAFRVCAYSTLILKENRGGTRLVDSAGNVESFPALLGTTVNSVGVGDVFAAIFVASLSKGVIEAGWRATYAASAYSQTTFPDLFKTYVQRDLQLNVEEMVDLGGVYLPWDQRQKYPLYLAAPDFSYANRDAIERALSSLRYHNFDVRRPIEENGEVPVDSELSVLVGIFNADCELLKRCALLFVVPTGRDPGTLVELGIAIEAEIPTVVFDAACENANTMVIAGASHYSKDLDSCLNAVFTILSEVAAK